MPSVIIRYLKILWFFAKVSLMKQMAYRTSFFLAVLGKTIRVAVIVIFFQAIFLNVKEIGGWKFEEVLLLYATFSLIDFLISVTFHRNLIYYLPDKIRKGEYDFRMVKPINLLFYTSFEVIDLMDLASIIPAFALLGYAFWKIDFSFAPLQFLLYGFLIINALIFLYALLVLLAATNFWAIQKTGLGRFYENVVRIARYPTDIYEKFWKILLVYVLPISIIAQVPAGGLLGKLSWPYLVYVLVFSVLFLVLAIRFWKFGLKRYTSVG